LDRRLWLARRARLSSNEHARGDQFTVAAWDPHNNDVITCVHIADGRPLTMEANPRRRCHRDAHNAAVGAPKHDLASGDLKDDTLAAVPR